MKNRKTEIFDNFAIFFFIQGQFLSREKELRILIHLDWSS